MTYQPVLGDHPTQELLDTYRQSPTAEVCAELERRGVQLWAHGLTGGTIEPSTATSHR